MRHCSLHKPARSPKLKPPTPLPAVPIAGLASVSVCGVSCELTAQPERHFAEDLQQICIYVAKRSTGKVMN